MIYYVEVGPKGSLIVRNTLGKKCLKLGDGNLTDLRIPSWSTSEDASIVNDNIKMCEDLSKLPTDIPVAVILGMSGLIALDFDDMTFDKALECSECNNIAKSVDKDGGHYVYSYTDNRLTEYINNINGKKLNKLDTLYGNCLLFINSKANCTKETIRAGELNEMPLAMQYFCIAHYAKAEQLTIYKEVAAKEVTKTVSTKIGFYLQKMINNINVGNYGQNDLLLSHLLKIITPKKYKDIMDLNKQKSGLSYKIDYHPDYLPEEESAHMYMVALSGVLTLDSSVNKDNHRWLMISFNNMFSVPLEDKRLESIIKRDAQSPRFQFDEKWASQSYTKYNKKQELIEFMCYVDGKTLNYIAYNHVTQNIDILNNSSIQQYMLLECNMQIKTMELLTQLTKVQVINRPDKTFGFDGDMQVFNTYRWSQEQYIFYNPDEYQLTWDKPDIMLEYNEDHPHYPKVTLAALKNAFGSKLEMFLAFMKRKYLYREHSPLIFVLFGVPHSFKSAVVNGVFSYLSYNRTKKITYETLLEKYNSWQINTDLVLLDEVHYILHKEQQKLIKTINEISGNDMITSVRQMYKDISNEAYKNEITFFMATNEPIALSNEIKDRRLVIFRSERKVSEALGMTDLDIKKNIMRESKDFAYYLAKMITPINDIDYQSNSNWKDEIYETFQTEALNIEDQILSAMENQNQDLLVELLLSIGLTYTNIAACIEYSSKLKRYYLRVLNTNEQLASVPSVFATTRDINVAKIKKKITMLGVTKAYQSDYIDGKRINSRKTVVDLGAALISSLEKANAADLTDVEI